MIGTKKRMQTLTSVSARYNHNTNYFFIFSMDKNVVDHVFLGKGRMNRRQYLNIIILIWLLSLVLGIMSWIIFGFSSLAFFWAMPIVTTLQTPFVISIMIRRWHDVSIPTIVWVIAGILNWMSNVLPIILSVFAIQELPSSVNSFWSLLYVIALIYSIALIFFPGTKNINQYWEQPKDLKKVSEIVRFWWTGKS